MAGKAKGPYLFLSFDGLPVADEDSAVVNSQNVAWQVLFDNVDDDNDAGQRAQKQPPTPLSDKDSTTAENKGSSESSPENDDSDDEDNRNQASSAVKTAPTGKDTLSDKDSTTGENKESDLCKRSRVHCVHLEYDFGPW